MESTSMFERRMYESRVAERVADDTVKATKNTDNHLCFLWVHAASGRTGYSLPDTPRNKDTFSARARNPEWRLRQ